METMTNTAAITSEARLESLRVQLEEVERAIRRKEDEEDGMTRSHAMELLPLFREKCNCLVLICAEAGVPLDPKLPARGLDREQLDEITRRESAFESFEALVEAPGGYRPTIRCKSASGKQAEELTTLADAYDGEMKRRGDRRRAFRS